MGYSVIGAYWIMTQIRSEMDCFWLTRNDFSGKRLKSNLLSSFTYLGSDLGRLFQGVGGRRLHLLSVWDWGGFLHHLGRVFWRIGHFSILNRGDLTLSSWLCLVHLLCNNLSLRWRNYPYIGTLYRILILKRCYDLLVTLGGCAQRFLVAHHGVSLH